MFYTFLYFVLGLLGLHACRVVLGVASCGFAGFTFWPYIFPVFVLRAPISSVIVVNLPWKDVEQLQPQRQCCLYAAGSVASRRAYCGPRPPCGGWSPACQLLIAHILFCWVARLLMNTEALGHIILATLRYCCAGSLPPTKLNFRFLVKAPSPTIQS